jgi:putative protein-disulfide isomerase
LSLGYNLVPLNVVSNELETAMTRFIYIYDTYCGWCYGAAPFVSALMDSGAHVSVMHCSLFQGVNAHRMGDWFGRIALQYDRLIAQLSGQVFSDAYRQKVLGNPDEVLETGLTAQAAALVHDQSAKVEMALARQLQTARYVQGVSASAEAEILKTLAQFGVTSSLKYGAGMAAEISAEATALMAHCGLQGVPALLREQNGRIEQITIPNFYKAPKQIAAFAA